MAGVADRQILVRTFSAPSRTFPKAEVASLARLAAASGDVALLIDKDGTIRDLAGDSSNLPLDHWAEWIGRSWIDVVSIESRPKVAAMQRDALAGTTTRWRHLNHPAANSDIDVPVMYRVVPLGADGEMLAIGRDLQEMADLQRRLLDAQQAVDREEKQRRQAESRHRLLFQSSTDPLLVVDSLSGRVFESNPAADILLPVVTRRRGAGSWGEGLDPKGADAMRALLAGVRASGRPAQVRVHNLAGAALLVTATPFREDGFALAMVRIAPVVQTAEGQRVGGGVRPEQAPSLSAVADHSPEAIVRTDVHGQIVAANAAFINMVRISTDLAIQGQSLDRWLDGAGIDLRVLMANARQHGVMRRFSTVLRDELGHQVDIELAAVDLPDEDPPGFGFLIREATRWHAGSAEANADPTPVAGRSVDQLTELVGRVPLKELVREAADVIERLAIEAALKLTDDNRALASDLLGLCRQSLYIKLHRYGLGDLGSESGGEDRSAGRTKGSTLAGGSPGRKPVSARTTPSKASGVAGAGSRRGSSASEMPVAKAAAKSAVGGTGREAAKAAAVSSRAAAKSVKKPSTRRRG